MVLEGEILLCSSGVGNPTQLLRPGLFLYYTCTFVYIDLFYFYHPFICSNEGTSMVLEGEILLCSSGVGDPTQLLRPGLFLYYTCTFVYIDLFYFYHPFICSNEGKNIKCQTASTTPESNRKTETGKIDTTLFDKACKCLAAGENH